MTSQASGYIATTVGRNIRVARESAGLTQRALALKVGVDQMMVSKWERGRHRPSDENLYVLAEQMGRDISWFYVDDEKAAA